MAKVSTKKILDRSIEDIRAGGWVCWDLYRDKDEGGGCVGHQACAVGLITLHSELGQAKYPAALAKDGVLPGAVGRALEALYNTIPKKFLRAYFRTEFGCGIPAKPGVDEMERAVINFNDGYGDLTYPVTEKLTKRKALNWFRKARKSLDPVA